MRNKHTYWHSEGESRLLRFGFSASPDFKDKLVEDGEKGSESADTQEEEVRATEITNQVNGAVDTYTEAAKSLPANFRAKLENELHQYVTTSVEAFDADAESGLDEGEFTKYKESLNTKIESNLVSFKRSMGIVEEAQELSAEEKEKAKEKAEKEKKTIEQLGAILANETPVEQPIGPLQLDEAGLQSNNPGDIQKEFTDYQDHFAQMQAARENMGEYSVAIFDFQAQYQAKLEELGAGDQVGAAAFVASGAVIGTAIGGWAFGLGTVIGAAVGALAYGVSKVAASAVLASKKKAIAEVANNALNKAKAVLKGEVSLFTAASEQSTQAGDDLNKAPEEFRDKYGELRSEMEAKYTGDVDALSMTKEDREAQLVELEAQRTMMLISKAELNNRRQEIVTGKDQVKDTEEQYGLGTDRLNDNNTQVDKAIKLVQGRIAQCPDGEKKDVLKKQLVKLEEAKKTCADGVAAIGDGVASIDDVKTKLKEGDEAAQNAVTQTDAQLDLIGLSMDMLTASMAEIDLARTSLEEMNASNLDDMTAQVQSIDQLDMVIADQVISAEIETIGANARFAADAPKIEELTIEAPSVLSAFNDGFEAFGMLLSDTVSGALDGLSDWLKEEMPILAYLPLPIPLAWQIDILSGFSKGIGEMSKGIGTMLENPVQVLKGLGKLVMLDGEAWAGMRDGILGTGERNFGKGLGVFLANVASVVATGGGSSTIAGARALGAAAYASKAGGVLAKSASYAVAAGKYMAIEGGRFALSIPRKAGNLAVGIVKAPFGIGKALFTKRLTTVTAKLKSLNTLKGSLSRSKAELLAKAKLPKGISSVDDVTALLKNGDDLAKMKCTAQQVKAMIEYRNVSNQLTRVNGNIAKASLKQTALKSGAMANVSPLRAAGRSIATQASKLKNVSAVKMLKGAEDAALFLLKHRGKAWPPNWVRGGGGWISRQYKAGNLRPSKILENAWKNKGRLDPRTWRRGGPKPAAKPAPAPGPKAKPTTSPAPQPYARVTPKPRAQVPHANPHVEGLNNTASALQAKLNYVKPGRSLSSAKRCQAAINDLTKQKAALHTVDDAAAITGINRDIATLHSLRKVQANIRQTRVNIATKRGLPKVGDRRALYMADGRKVAGRYAGLDEAGRMKYVVEGAKGPKTIRVSPEGFLNKGSTYKLGNKTGLNYDGFTKGADGLYHPKFNSPAGKTYKVNMARNGNHLSVEGRVVPKGATPKVQPSSAPGTAVPKGATPKVQPSSAPGTAGRAVGAGDELRVATRELTTVEGSVIGGGRWRIQSVSAADGTSVITKGTRTVTVRTDVLGPIFQRNVTNALQQVKAGRQLAVRGDVIRAADGVPLPRGNYTVTSNVNGKVILSRQSGTMAPPKQFILETGEVTKLKFIRAPRAPTPRLPSTAVVDRVTTVGTGTKVLSRGKPLPPGDYVVTQVSGGRVTVARSNALTEKFELSTREAAKLNYVLAA